MNESTHTHMITVHLSSMCPDTCSTGSYVTRLISLWTCLCNTVMFWHCIVEAEAGLWPSVSIFRKWGKQGVIMRRNIKQVWASNGVKFLTLAQQAGLAHLSVCYCCVDVFFSDSDTSSRCLQRDGEDRFVRFSEEFVVHDWLMQIDLCSYIL